MEKKKVYVIVKDGKQLGIRYNNKTYLHKENEPYEKLFQIIEKENPGFFNQLINNGYETTTLKELEHLEKEYALKNLKAYDNNINPKAKKTRRFNTSQKLALGFAGLCLLGLAGLGIAKYNKSKKQSLGISNTENVKDYDFSLLTKEDVEKMNFFELSKYLNNGLQQETFKLLDEIQNKFNSDLSSKIKLETDGKNQLYLKAEELIALHVMANSDTYHKTTLASIYGDLLNAEQISANYTQASRVMWSYYSRAKEPSGIDKLFSDIENQKLVKTFEQLIIAYNKADANDKKELGKEFVYFFESLTDISKIDNALETNKEAVSYILTVGLPFAYSNGIISESTYSHLVEINETITCDELYNQVESAEDIAKNKILENNIILLEIPRALNEKNIKVANRDINVVFERIKKYTNDYKVANSTTPSTTTNKKEEITRQEAVEIFGEETVKEKEEEAEKIVETNNAQAEEDAKEFANGYNTAYEQAYLKAAADGQKISNTVTGSLKYQEGYAKGLEAGYNDGMIEYKAKEEAIKNNDINNGTVIEKPLLPEAEEENKIPNEKDDDVIPPVDNEEPSTDATIIEKPLLPEEPEDGEIATDEFGNTIQTEKVRTRA